MDSITVARLVRQLKNTVSPDDADTHEALERAISAIPQTENLRVLLERARRAPEQAEFEVRVWWETSDRYGVDYAGSAPGWQTVAWCSMRQYAGIVADALLAPDRGAGEVNTYRKAEVWGPGRLTPQGREEGRRLYDRIWRCPACGSVGDGYGIDSPKCLHCHQPLEVDHYWTDVAGAGAGEHQKGGQGSGLRG
jgi:hypothetical protein